MLLDLKRVSTTFQGGTVASMWASKPPGIQTISKVETERERERERERAGEREREEKKRSQNIYIQMSTQNPGLPRSQSPMRRPSGRSTGLWRKRAPPCHRARCREMPRRSSVSTCRAETPHPPRRGRGRRRGRRSTAWTAPVDTAVPPSIWCRTRTCAFWEAQVWRSGRGALVPGWCKVWLFLESGCAWESHTLAQLGRPHTSSKPLENAVLFFLGRQFLAELFLISRSSLLGPSWNSLVLVLGLPVQPQRATTGTTVHRNDDRPAARLKVADPLYNPWITWEDGRTTGMATGWPGDSGALWSLKTGKDHDHRATWRWFSGLGPNIHRKDRLISQNSHVEWNCPMVQLVAPLFQICQHQPFATSVYKPFSQYFANPTGQKVQDCLPFFVSLDLSQKLDETSGWTAVPRTNCPERGSIN